MQPATGPYLVEQTLFSVSNFYMWQDHNPSCACACVLPCTPASVWAAAKRGGGSAIVACVLGCMGVSASVGL